MNKNMRRLLSVVLFLMTGIAGYAQVDRFEVGPYEVEYRGEGDYRSRLKRGVNLYEYFDLKKDTVFIKVKPESHRLKNAIQLDLSYSLPRVSNDGGVNVVGLDASWKHAIARSVYFNAGLSMGLSFGKSGSYWGVQKETFFEVGLPLSLEFCKLDKKKSSMYAGIGVVPTFYTAPESMVNKDGELLEGESGLFVAPRLDLGAYVPFMHQLIRIGGFAQFNLNCVGNNDLFKERLGRLYFGANIGLIF